MVSTLRLQAKSTALNLFLPKADIPLVFSALGDIETIVFFNPSRLYILNFGVGMGGLLLWLANNQFLFLVILYFSNFILFQTFSNTTGMENTLVISVI